MDVFERANAEFAKLQSDDKDAKARGAIVGRYITTPVADGYAYYRIISQAAGTCRMEHVKVGDGYRDITLEQCGCKLPLAAVTARLESRDAMDRLFSSRRA